MHIFSLNIFPIYFQDCAPDLSDVCEAEYKSHKVKDTSIWRYKKQLIQRTRNVLRKLGIEPK